MGRHDSGGHELQFHERRTQVLQWLTTYDTKRYTLCAGPELRTAPDASHLVSDLQGLNVAFSEGVYAVPQRSVVDV